MKFSIVTPAYNASKYLPSMLESLKLQSFSDWELRIVDDGSSDETPRIIEKFSNDDKRIKPIYLRNNSGSCFVPRQMAINASIGDFIVNIDADDTVEKDYLLKLDATIKVTAAELVYANMIILSEKSAYKLIPENDDLYSHTFEGRKIFHWSLDQWRVSGVGATSRTLALQSLRLFNKDRIETNTYCHFEDENLTRLDLFLARKVAFCNADYFYRQVDDSITHKIGFSRFELLNADMKLCDFIKKNFGERSEEYALIQRQLFHHTVESIRLLGIRCDFDRRNEAENLSRKAFRSLNLNILKGRVSPRYLALIRLGYPVSKFILGIYGGK